ncbi:MAG: lipocalin-like domain-containing protein [Candidatus Hodarchaeota archaeon]
MKKFFVLFVLLCLIVVAQSCKNVKTQELKGSPHVGAWEYVLDDQEGLFIATETHFTWIITEKNRQSFTGETPTEAEKAAAYSSVIASAGTYTFSDSIFTWNIKYSSNPNLAGTSFKSVNKFEGNMSYYKVLNPDGSISNTGAARRVGTETSQK